MGINKIICGDCIEEMKKLEDNSIDAIITDPPYGLEFMGKDWDKFKEGHNIAGGDTGKDTPYARSKPTPAFYQLTNSDMLNFQNFTYDWAKECLRVLKPGGYLLSFGGTRTYHRMACGIEDAGFEIRDCIMWLYGSGFPKSLNIGKQIDKIQGTERKIVGNYVAPDGNERHNSKKGKEYDTEFITGFKENRIKDKGNSEWEGWGTALKPAVEPIVVARKPLSEKNVALNVLKWGTGGINIDECRIPLQPNEDLSKEGDNHELDTQEQGWGFKSVDRGNQGRFPANIILDEEAGEMLDEQTGTLKSGKMGPQHTRHTDGSPNGIYGKFDVNHPLAETIGDSGGASRFFYCAKASKSERNFGLDDFEDKQKCPMSKESRIGECINASKGMERFETICKNNHPTVKPIKLMEYLVKLVSKEGSVILDPFLGSGTTGIACAKLNRNFIGIEKEEDYVKIAQARIKPYLKQRKLI